MSTGKMLKLLYWFFGGVVALLVVASVAISFVDWNQYRGVLSNLASSQMGMRVELGGRVGVSLVPRPAVSAETVRLFPEGGSVSDIVATADRIEMRLGLAALMQGRLAIQHLGFDGLDLALEEKADGTWAVRGWPEADPDDQGAATIQMDRLEIVGGTVHFIDRQGTTRSVEGLTFDLEGSLPAGPLEWDGSFLAAGQNIRTNGRMRPSLRDGVHSLKTDIILSGGQLQIAGSLSEGGFAGRVQASGNDMQAFVSAWKSVLDNANTLVPVPKQSFALDLQIDREAGIYRAVTRTLKLGETHGRLDLTVAEKEGGFHVAGTTSLGIIKLDDWYVSNEPTEPVVPAQEPAAASPGFLTGTLDVAVEGVQVGEGLVQQLDAELKLSDDGVYLTGFQALLPGASGLFFVGDIDTAGRGAGDLRMTSGNLAELLRWAQIDVVGRIPAGRLATAELATRVTLQEGFWQLGELKGRIDTTNVTGHLEGSLDKVWPTRVELSADSINFDAYLPENMAEKQDPRPSVAMEQPADGSTFRVTVRDILMGGAKFQGTELEASVRDGAFHVAGFQTRQGDGAAIVSGVIRPFDDQPELNGEARLSNWSWPLVRHYVSAAKPYIRALGVGRVNGDATVSGKADNLHVSASLSARENRKLTASGNVNLAGKDLKSYDLQGSFEHDNLRAVLQQLGMELHGPVPANMTFSVARPAASGGNVDTFRLSGDVAGGQAIAEGRRVGPAQEWTVTYDHRRAQDVATLVGLTSLLPSADQPVRGTANAQFDTSGWEIKAMDVRNGNTRLQGSLMLKDANQLNGSLKLAGLVLSPDMVSGRGPTPANAQTSIPPELFQYRGAVSLALDSVQLAGQVVTAPNASLSLTEQGIRFGLGKDGGVNGTPSTIALTMKNMAPAAEITGELKVPNIDIGRALTGSGLKAAISGAAALDFQFESTGDTAESLLRQLRGQGNVQGRAGALNFLSVPNLVREMTSAPSVSSFLGTIGTWLREGSSSYNTIDASFTLDAGTALVEQIAANGDWGQLSLDGQINFLDRFLSLKGVLDLAAPPDAPDIPVAYEGGLDNPGSAWASRALERFVVAGIERRIRAGLQRELDQIQGDEPAQNAGAAVFGRALGMLGKLRERQEQKKAEEAARKQDEKESAAQDSEEQRP